MSDYENSYYDPNYVDPGEIIGEAEGSAGALWEACAKLAEAAILAERRAAKRPNEPEYLEGDPPVVRFWKRFPGAIAANVPNTGRRYHYVAIGIRHEKYSPRGLRPHLGETEWFITGSREKGRSFTWEGLMEFIGEEYWDTVEVLHGLVELKPGEEI
ncbi:hypothetical protein PBI_SUZY_36 [Gordonia phage Suzy]|uniref:Uncharacterized protein n=1 Tax=Gordonia phage Suzy TaxID=2201430 RepID=A0A2Z4Q7Y8_9CAUD|nr:hypothetical protein HOT44_gp36 [Gordonia phage Suzy]AWY06141.1 hypothetical protein PBI_SUZY_36 [Gordonia phage Suzy]